MVAIIHLWILSTENAASKAEDLNFLVYFN